MLNAIEIMQLAKEDMQLAVDRIKRQDEELANLRAENAHLKRSLILTQAMHKMVTGVQS